MLSKTVLALLAATGVASARKCENLTLQVDVQSRNAVFNLATPATSIDVVDFILNLSRQGHNYSAEILGGYKTVQKQYQVAATYCEPDSGPSKTVQLLTHGIGFDRSYWDLSADNYNYSYVDVATDKYGYSTFFYDRIGIGASTHGSDPVNEIQEPLELEALHQLTQYLKQGKVCGKTFDKVVHVGHSFGSALSYSLTVEYPNDSAGLILTGFSQNSSFTADFELGGNFIPVKSIPSLAPKFVAGYIASSDVNAVQTNFFAPGQFDPAILQLAFATGQPVTPGELLTVGGLTSLVNPTNAPVLIITGGRDLPFCGGDCLATGNPAVASLLAPSAKYFPRSAKFATTVVPNSGHGLNLEYSHTFTYKTILDFLAANVPK